MHQRIIAALALVSGALVLQGCGPEHANGETTAARETAGVAVAARDTVIESVIEASGVAEPIEQATLATRLMGQVTDVRVHEGDRVAAGELLLRIDARELEARRGQVAAQLAQAEAASGEAQLMARRLRALYADSAAPRAQLDAAEAGLARAEASVAQARAGAAEVDAMRSYAELRAPFAGVVTQRFVDVGAFAAPGSPLVTVQNGTRLRVSGAAGPETVRALRRGAGIDLVIEGVAVRGVIEGVVPSPGGQTYTVNAAVDNAGGRFLPHSAAVLLLPAGRHHGIVAPAAAVTRDGDLTRVRLVTPGGSEVRWVRLGRVVGEDVEVLAGLSAGDRVLVARPEAAR